jgi:DNA-binding NarL/FixJ family response regulator
MAIRVLLVEDNDVYRATLELLLSGREGIEIVGAVADGADAAEAAAAAAPDVVVMDYRLPGLDGAQATAAVRDAAPAAAIVCLTAEATAEEQAAVLAAGAVALVEKGKPTQELVAVIRAAAERDEGAL